MLAYSFVGIGTILWASNVVVPLGINTVYSNKSLANVSFILSNPI